MDKHEHNSPRIGKGMKAVGFKCHECGARYALVIGQNESPEGIAERVSCWACQMEWIGMLADGDTDIDGNDIPEEGE